MFIALLAGCPVMDMDPDPTPKPDPMTEPEPMTPGTMAAPTLVAGNDQLTVSWIPPEKSGDGEITAYHLRHSSDGGTTWTEIISDIGTHTSYTITPLTHKKISYRVQVRAVNDIGNGPWSESATGELVITAAAPAILVILGNGRLTVKWTAPYNEGSDITGYELEYKLTSDLWTDAPAVTQRTTDADTTTDTIMGLTNGASYDVQVRAVNGIYGGSWSEPATAILPTVATEVPAGTAVSVILSDDIDDAIINANNPTVTLAAVTTPTTPADVALPTVDETTGIIMVTAHTSPGTYEVSGADGGIELFATEKFSVTLSPQDNDELKTAVTEGIDTWGNTANLNYIVTTAVTDMSEMFKDKTAFNGDISSWDVSTVTNMSNMFNSASAFNGNISGWNVSAVTDMRFMFSNANAFNGNISGWDVSSVTTMGSMFYFARAFTGDLEEWKAHWTPETGNKLNDNGKYTGTKNGMFTGSGLAAVDTDTMTDGVQPNFPSWY